MKLKSGTCVYCGKPATWLMCNECLIITKKSQIAWAESTKLISQTDEWKNALLESHATTYIEEKEKEIKELSELT